MTPSQLAVRSQSGATLGVPSSRGQGIVRAGAIEEEGVDVEVGEGGPGRAVARLPLRRRLQRTEGVLSRLRRQCKEVVVVAEERLVGAELRRGLAVGLVGQPPEDDTVLVGDGGHQVPRQILLDRDQVGGIEGDLVRLAPQLSDQDGIREMNDELEFDLVPSRAPLEHEACPCTALAVLAVHGRCPIRLARHGHDALVAIDLAGEFRDETGAEEGRLGVPREIPEGNDGDCMVDMATGSQRCGAWGK